MVFASRCGAKRRRTPALTASCRSVARAAVGDHGRPSVGPSTTHSSAPMRISTRISSQSLRCCQAQWSMPASHLFPPFPHSHENAAARVAYFSTGLDTATLSPTVGGSAGY